jgi:hypothetical protein
MNAPQAHGKFITSDRVQGTDVYSASERERIGEIHNLVIDKVSGNVAYADMTFGGFLGLGEGHYPIPWQALKYDTQLDGYVTGITERQLKRAPESGPPDQVDRAFEERLHKHYGIPGYWGYI